jgi:hypothetical protein
MINADYATIFSNLPLEKINAMELHLLTLFDFSVKITLQEFEKMNKTIKDLNVAANAMRLRMAALPSPHSESGSVSISGRHAFKRAEVIQQLEDEDDEESIHFEKASLGQMDESSTFLDSRPSPPMTPTVSTGFYSDPSLPFDLKKSPSTNADILPSSTKSTWSASQSSRDLEETSLLSVKYPGVVDEHLESIHEHEEPLEERKPLGHRRRTSIQIAVDNALLILVKYLPGQSHHHAKVHVTTGDPA